MNLDRALQADMEAALLARAQTGPNADKPVSERALPRVSNLSQGCAALDYHYLAGSPSDGMDAFGAASVTAGKALEDGILLDLEAALSKRFGEPFVFEREVRVTTDWFTGSADAWNAKHRILADSKTASPWQWGRKLAEGSPGDAYVKQLNMYALGLGAVEIIVPVMAVGKTRKDEPGVYLPFTFAPDPSMIAPLKAQAERAMAAVLSHTPPARGYKRSYWLCAGYCQFRTACWKGA